MLNYIREIVLLLMGKTTRRSNFTVHLTIRNIFDLLTESANSNQGSYVGAQFIAPNSQGVINHAPTDFVTLRAALTRLLPLLALFCVFMSTTGQLMPGCGGGGSSAISGESTAIDGSEGGSVDVDDIGDSAVMPPVGINAPMATLPDYGTGSTYTSSASTEGMTTTSDTGEGVDSEQDGQYVAGTTDETVVMRIDRIVQERLARKAMQNKNQFAFVHDEGAGYVGAQFIAPNSQGVINHAPTGFFMRSAIADDVANACDEAGVSYVQVHTGQPFTLLVPGTNDQKVKLKFTDCDTLWSENWVEETVNTKSVHTGNAAFDLTPGPRRADGAAAAAVAAVLEESTSNIIYNLVSGDSGNIGQKMLEADGIFSMGGASSTDYQATGLNATSAQALAYHKDDKYLSLRELTGGVDVNRSWYDTGNEVWRLSALGTATVDADEYVSLKYQNEGLWFVTDPSAAEDRGIIYNAMDVISSVWTSEIVYDADDTATLGSDLVLKKGHTFAVDSNSLGFAVFEVAPTADTNHDGMVDSNDTGDLWLRMADTSGPLAGAKITLPATASTPVIEDIVVVKNQDQSVDGDTGTLYLLDSANDRIHVATYAKTEDHTPPYEDTTYTLTTTFTSSDSIVVGDNPTSILVNSDGTRVYVLNQTDSTISVIKPSNKKVVATVDLASTVYPGKTLTLSPTTMAFQPKTVTSGVESTNGYLLVTDAILKTVMVVDTDNITESSGLQIAPAVLTPAALRSLRR